MAEEQRDTGGSQTSGPALDQKEKDSRLWGTLCHLSALAGYGIFGIGWVLGPLVVWLLKREEFPFVEDQGKEAVNFQITMFIIGLVIYPSTYMIHSYYLVYAFGVFNLVMIIMASMKANTGEKYRYPFALRLIQ